MNGLIPRCHVVIIGVTVALLAGCGGAQLPIGVSEARPAKSVRPMTSGFRVLFDFSEHSVYGINPVGLIAANGTLYGTTSTGGDGYGTVFSLTTDGTAKVLHAFLGGSDGEFPAAPPIAVDGTLYGTTSGGLQGGGTVFSIRTDGSHYRVLHSFTGGSDGMNPMAGLIAAHGVLYGTTYSGGDTGGGTVFSLRVSDGYEQILHSFGGGADGLYPDAGLLKINGVFYGTTASGGIAQSVHGAGTVYEITKAGAERVLFAFDGSDGTAPETPLAESKGRLYGTTLAGGYDNNGVLFRIRTDGTDERTLHEFSGSDPAGFHPFSGLTRVNETFYGGTGSGGANGGGTIFSISRRGSHLTVLHAFGTYDGAAPNCIFSVDGAFYGTTLHGGEYGDGTAFALSP